MIVDASGSFLSCSCVKVKGPGMLVKVKMPRSCACELDSNGIVGDKNLEKVYN